MSFKIIVTSLFQDGNEERLFENIFDQELVTIGRDKSNNVHLPDTTRLVSRKHAEIRLSDNLFKLVDVGSKHGTILNDKKVSGDVILHHNDQIQIGNFILFFNILQQNKKEVVKEEIVGKESKIVTEKEVHPVFKNSDITVDEIHRFAYERLCKLSNLFVKDAPPLSTPEEIENLCLRLEKVLSILLACLSDALKGRQRFEEEFNVEATRILSWDPNNRVKYCADVNELAGYLLDWRSKDDSDKSGKALEEAFRDLILHQSGLIAGLNECLNGLLKIISPDRIDKEVKDRGIKLGGINLLFILLPFMPQLRWKRFVEKHSELTEEKVKTFEEVLGPEFAKGYLSLVGKMRS